MEHLERATRERSAAYYNVIDKIITLSATLLAVTVTFRGNLLSAAHGQIRVQWVLFLAWICLAISVAAGLVTLFGHVLARTQAIQQIIDSGGGVGGGKAGCVFYFSYFICAVSFAIALIAFVSFAIANT